jgi:hypothetical protein
VSFLRSASGSGKESGRGTERGTSSEAGEWQRYDFNSGKIVYKWVSVKMFLMSC